MLPTYEQRIAEIVRQQPKWSGEQIARHLRDENPEAPGRSAVYECLRRLQIGGPTRPPTAPAPIIKQLEQEKQDLRQTIEQLVRDRAAQYTIPSQQDVIRYGVIADTQVGSLYVRFDALKTFYRHVAKHGITDILHAGDVLDGWRLYRGQEWELRDRGWEEQLDRLESDCPHEKGITTHFITGNHDASFKHPIGIDVGAEIVKRRPDFHFLGEDVGRVVFENKTKAKWIVDLIHPSGGTAYALSYHLQKIIESLSGGTKPHMIVVGHYHKAELIPQYRNVVGLQAGTFQSQTPFMARKHIAAHLGGWIIEVAVGVAPDCLVNTVKAQCISFFEPMGGETGEKNG